MKSLWITHKNKRILYCDYRDFSLSDFEGLEAELEWVAELLQREPEGTVLGLSDIRGSVASREVVELFKERASDTARYVKKQAVVGVTGLKRLFFETIVRVSGQHARTFDTLEAAKDWLVSEE
ncbi:MAG: hypothetical protein JW900_07615 [Anaerolineae bacterium]|nr:hypothetical protein [Anaerolineae bacterium]